MVLVVKAVARCLRHEVQHVRHRSENFVRTQDVAVFGIAFDGTLVRIVKLNLEVFAVLASSLTEEFVELGEFFTELAIDLVTTDARQVVTLRIEECILEIRAS